MITKEATHATEEATPHAPAGAGAEALPFLTSPFELESAPPLLLESVPTPFGDSLEVPMPFVEPLETEPLLLESAPTALESIAPQALEAALSNSEGAPSNSESVAPSLESVPDAVVEDAGPAAVVEAVPRPARTAAEKPAPKVKTQPAQRVKANAPDPYAVGVRLLRMAPAWLLFTTVVCGSLVLVMGWVRGDGDTHVASVPPEQNDSRAVIASPKADAPAPKSAAANVPEVTTAAAPAPAPAAAPIQTAAQPAAPAPAEQPAPAPKPAEKPQVQTPAPVNEAGAAGGKFTVQVGSYSSQSEANEHVSRLRAAGFEARSAAAELPGRGTWYRVQVGRFADRAAASQAVSQLRSKGAAASAMVAPL
jgi:cell division septation protein DedD